MRVVINIDDSIKDPRAVAYAARGCLMQVVAINRLLIRMAERAGTPFPPLLTSGVRWKREPWAGEVDEFANIREIYARGWGDCDDCVAAYVAQKIEASKRRVLGRWVFDKWGIKVYWRRTENGGYLYHAQVRRPDGFVDDPSRLIGM